MPYLAFNLNDGNEFVFDLIEDRLRLGRTPDNDIVIDNSYISAHHAELLRQPDGCYDLVDLQSSNGTLVNGKRIERVRLKGGDRLRFGQLSARFRERPPRGLAPDQPTQRTGGSALETGRANGKPGDSESAAPPAEAAAPRKETARQEPATLSGVKMAGSEVAAFARLERLRREQAEMEERREALTLDLERTQADLARAKEGLARVHDEVEQARAQLRREQQEAQAAKGDAERELAQLRGEVKRLQDEAAALRDRHRELEEKNEVLRRGLATDEATVILFAQDIIKRLDLIDSLRQRYAGAEVAGQLQTLRASLEDILTQHGISELRIATGTPVDADLRRRIVVVESAPGSGPARVMETRRSGFVRANKEGNEHMLRKVEVSTTGAW